MDEALGAERLCQDRRAAESARWRVRSRGASEMFGADSDPDRSSVVAGERRSARDLLGRDLELLVADARYHPAVRTSEARLGEVHRRAADEARDEEVRLLRFGLRRHRRWVGRPAERIGRCVRANASLVLRRCPDRQRQVAALAP